MKQIVKSNQITKLNQLTNSKQIYPIITNNNCCQQCVCCPTFNQCSQQLSNNNIYVVGFYKSLTPVNLGNGITLPKTSDKFRAYYIIKYNNLNQALWAKSIYTEEINDIIPKFSQCITDSANNLLVVGTYNSTIPVQLGNEQTLSSTSGITSSFIIKYNSQGNVQWTNTILASSTSAGTGITIDSKNNILVTGSYNSAIPVQLGNEQILSSTSNILNPFIIKYNSQGKVQWANTILASSESIGIGITTDSQNNVLVTGSYNSTILVQLGNGKTLSSTSDIESSFIVKYNSKGEVQWAKTIYVTSIGAGITTDSANNVLVTGGYNSTSGIFSSFIIKYNSQGNIQWDKSILASIDSIGFGITTDTQNNVLVTGSYNSTISVQLGNGKTLSSTSGIKNPFIIKYNSQGNVVWTRTIKLITQTNIDNIAYFNNSLDIRTDSINNIIITGGYISNTLILIKPSFGNVSLPKTNIDNTTEISLPKSFIIKYNSEGIAFSSIINNSLISSGLSITY